MASDENTARTRWRPLFGTDEVSQRTIARTLLGAGALGLLTSIYLPLVDPRRSTGPETLKTIADHYHTPWLPALIVGAVLLLGSTLLLLERVQTPGKLLAVLALACTEVLALAFNTVVGFVLAWTDTGPLYEKPEKPLPRVPHFHYGAAFVVISSALTLAGAVWWCLHAKREAGS